MYVAPWSSVLELISNLLIWIVADEDGVVAGPRPPGCPGEDSELCPLQTSRQRSFDLRAQLHLSGEPFPLFVSYLSTSLLQHFIQTKLSFQMCL